MDEPVTVAYGDWFEVGSNMPGMSGSWRVVVRTYDSGQQHYTFEQRPEMPAICLN